MNIINDYDVLIYFVTVHAFCAFFWRTQKNMLLKQWSNFRYSTGGGGGGGGGGGWKKKKIGGGIVITKVQQTHVYTHDI